MEITIDFDRYHSRCPRRQHCRQCPRTGAHLQYDVARADIGRIGQPDEIVGPVVFLASDAAAMVTGHVLAVDGGYLAQ